MSLGVRPAQVAYHRSMWLELLRLVGWLAVVILAVSLIFLAFTYALRWGG